MLFLFSPPPPPLLKGFFASSAKAAGHRCVPFLFLPNRPRRPSWFFLDILSIAAGLLKTLFLSLKDTPSFFLIPSRGETRLPRLIQFPLMKLRGGSALSLIVWIWRFVKSMPSPSRSTPLVVFFLSSAPTAMRCPLDPSVCWGVTKRFSAIASVTRSCFFASSLQTIAPGRFCVQSHYMRFFPLHVDARCCTRSASL